MTSRKRVDRVRFTHGASGPTSQVTLTRPRRSRKMRRRGVRAVSTTSRRITIPPALRIDATVLARWTSRPTNHMQRIVREHRKLVNGNSCESVTYNGLVAPRSIRLTFFHSAATCLHMPARLTRELSKHEGRKPRASERHVVGCCEVLASLVPRAA